MFWLIIFLSLALNILYYLVSQKLKIKIFSRYFVGFILYSSLILSLLIYFKLDFILVNFFSFFVIYLLFFISLFLSMSMKYIKSPTYLIFKILNKKHKKTNYKKIRKTKNTGNSNKRFRKNKIFFQLKIRKMSLKENLGIIINLFFFMKKFLNIKSEG